MAALDVDDVTDTGETATVIEAIVAKAFAAHEGEPADPTAVDHDRRRETRIAPDSLDVDRVPSPFVTDEERPMRVAEAAESYQKVVRHNWVNEDFQSRYERSLGRYAAIHEADRIAQQRYEEDLTTIMITRRLSPTNVDGEWISPYTLDQRPNDSDVLRKVRERIYYQLRDYDSEWLRVVSATDSAATPHEHRYYWVRDPDDEISADQFDSAIAYHVDHVARAFDVDHGAGAIRVHHDPPRSDVPLTDWQGVREQTSTTDDWGHFPSVTAGAKYLASQLPHLVIGDVYDGRRVVDVARTDGGAIQWACANDWFGLSIDVGGS